MKKTTCDVLVVGAGVAGSCAAIAAARSGVRTSLIERRSYLGGAGYAGMFQHICGLYLNGNTMPTETLNGGITREIVGLLKQRAPEKLVQKIGQVYVLPYAATDLHNVLSFLVEAENNVTVQLKTVVTGVEAGNGKIASVTVESPGGTQTITATMVIDCTGNGEVAAMAGAECELSPVNERQLAGFTIRVAGVENNDDVLSLKVPYYCAQAVARSILPPSLKFTTFTSGDRPDEGFIKMSLDGEDTPERDQRAHKNAEELLVYLGKVLPAFRNARITDTALNVQDREGRRIIGDYLLTEDDILSSRKFSDAVVKNAWPIELWDRSKGTLYKYVPCGDYYEIPYRCLTVTGMTNLLTAGRCISVSREALGSTRVMGACMALGEQAGLAAALYVRNREYLEYKRAQP